ncbi:MAG: retroviral-like aspartic protease family protein [Cyanobacteria bacterium J06607_15]
MKVLSCLILGTAVFNSLAMPLWAQNSNSCYMLDSNGKAIDLGHLCRQTNSSPRRRRSLPERYTPERTQAVSQKGVQIVPIKSRRGGIPTIDVKFNNKYVFEMMLDTGASGVVITQAMASKLKVNQTESVYVSTPSNNYFKMPMGYVYSLEVGKFKQKNIPVITSPSLDMGLLGQSFFSNYDITIKSDVVEFRAR